MRHHLLVSLVAAVAIWSVSPAARQSAPPDSYLGQTPPGDVPELFMPGVVSTGAAERDMAIMPDGREFYFCVSTPGYASATIMVSRRNGDRWTEPEVAPHMDDARYMNLEPAIAPDGQRFYFMSNRPAPDDPKGTRKQDVWVMDRRGDGWGEPRNLGAPVNTEAGEYFPSVTRSGTLYFTRENRNDPNNGIYRSRLVNGVYTEPERLPAQVNLGDARFNAFIDPDERYIIVPAQGGPTSVGGVDYFIVFRNGDGTWSDPINLGGPVNTAGSVEYSASVSPDGRYFFFMSSRGLPEDRRPARFTATWFRAIHDSPQNGNPDIYWMKADFLMRLKPPAR